MVDYIFDLLPETFIALPGKRIVLDVLGDEVLVWGGDLVEDPLGVVPGAPVVRQVVHNGDRHAVDVLNRDQGRGSLASRVLVQALRFLEALFQQKLHVVEECTERLRMNPPEAPVVEKDVKIVHQAEVALQRLAEQLHDVDCRLVLALADTLDVVDALLVSLEEDPYQVVKVFRHEIVSLWEHTGCKCYESVQPLRIKVLLMRQSIPHRRCSLGVGH